MSTVYKGYRITTTVTRPSSVGKVTHAVYRVDREDGDGWKLIREGVLYGPFESLEEAHSATDAVARGWIDQQGK